MDFDADVDRKFVPKQILEIVDLEIPMILSELFPDTEYYIIGGRAYNLLMKTPVNTIDYDIKFPYDITTVKKFRDMIMARLWKNHPNISIIGDDHQELSRIVARMSGIDYDILDLGIITYEHQSEKYDITRDYLIGPNGLKYGGLGYLLGRLEELTNLRWEEKEAVKKAKLKYEKLKKELDYIIPSLIRNRELDQNLVNNLVKNISNFGKSAESDIGLSVNISGLIDQIVENLVENHDLESLPDFVEYVEDPDKDIWIRKNRRTGIDWENPLDLAIILYYMDDVFSASNVINNDLGEKTDKYIRTAMRLDNLQQGLIDPDEYYSDFFIQYLAHRCKNQQSIKMFLNQSFDCRKIKKRSNRGNFT